jgi:ribonuclease HI
MPWRPALLKGNRVLARCDGEGAFVDEGGRVEVRYRASDPRAYRAGVRNLSPVAGEILPDDHCVPAAEPDASAASGSASSSGTSSSRARSGASRSKPADLPKEPTSQATFVAYTDGACSGNPGPAGLGVVLLHGASRRELSEYLGVGTNNVAELTAILRAIEAVGPSDESVHVHTDSQYAIGVLQKGWKPKANQALIASIKTAMSGLKRLHLVYVPGHAGVPLNERADALARMAVSSRSNTAWREVAVGRERAEA